MWNKQQYSCFKSMSWSRSNSFRICQLGRTIRQSPTELIWSIDVLEMDCDMRVRKDSKDRKFKLHGSRVRHIVRCRTDHYTVATRIGKLRHSIGPKEKFPRKSRNLRVDNEKFGNYSNKWKHIDIKRRHVMEPSENTSIDLDFVPTDEMKAEFLIKLLTSKPFRTALMNVNMFKSATEKKGEWVRSKN